MSANKKKGKKMSKGAKLYLGACLLSFTIGIISLGIARNITRSVLESSEKTISIPSYEEIIKANEKILESQAEKDILTEEKVPESTENTISSEAYEESVKVSDDAVLQAEKVISFTAPCNGDIMKRFSIDKPLKSRTMGDFRIHSGVDIRTDTGTTVCAAADGVVENIYDDNLLGITIVIAHNETLKTEYSNIAGADMIKIGDEVKEGQAIGCVGNTAKGELLDDAHLHFAISESEKYVNPEKYIKFETMN